MFRKPVVLFGPFIGEFGWELLYWQGWVRKACRTIFKDYHKIAASFPGRYPFYPDVDEFWEHPKEIIGRKPISSKGYTTDNWFAGLLERGENRDVETDAQDLWEGSLLLDTLIKYYKKRLPDDALILSPANWIALPDLPPAFGVKTEKHTDGTFTLTTERLALKHQILESIRPTEKGKAILQTLISPDEKLIAIFPRARFTRRPDKNWPKENYEVLIAWLQEKFPQFPVAILGEPGGAYFSDGIVPHGCLDLVSIDSDFRTDIQIAALKQSRLALGAMSGGFVMALAVGCPSVMWGYKHNRKIWYETNYCRTPLIFIPKIQPTMSDVCEILSPMFKKFSLWSSFNFTYFQWLEPMSSRVVNGARKSITTVMSKLKKPK